MAKTELTKRLERLSNSELAQIYNEVSERKITKFSDHTTAVRRTQLVLEKAGLDFSKHDGRITVGEASAPLRGDRRVITVLAKENPKRAGTVANTRFALYKNGMVVEDFVALCAKKIGDDRAKSMRDLNWNMGMGYIKVEG